MIPQKSRLFKVAKKLLKQAFKYRLEYHSVISDMYEPAIWVNGTSGEMVIITDVATGEKMLRHIGAIPQISDRGIHQHIFEQKGKQ